MRHAALCLALAAAPCGMAFAADPPATCPVANGQTVSYDIIREGNVIGHQTVHYAGAAPDLTVTIDMTAQLSALGVRVYHYAHHSEEHWRDGALATLASKTDDDGTPKHVDAGHDPGGPWHGTHGASPGTGPLFPSSFWNAQTVTQNHVLDREDGAVVPVAVSPQGEEVVHVGGRDVPARKYDLAGVVRGTVWYDHAGCWVRALFHTRVDGSLVEVRMK